jgi:hypothetical protein
VRALDICGLLTEESSFDIVTRLTEHYQVSHVNKRIHAIRDSKFTQEEEDEEEEFDILESNKNEPDDEPANDENAPPADNQIDEDKNDRKVQSPGLFFQNSKKHGVPSPKGTPSKKIRKKERIK